MNIKIIAKTDIPFSLLGIRQGPLLESDCSSLHFMSLLNLTSVVSYIFHGFYILCRDKYKLNVFS